jgi:hypothetical protein
MPLSRPSDHAAVAAQHDHAAMRPRFLRQGHVTTPRVLVEVNMLEGRH